jgi:hypothetical protein
MNPSEEFRKFAGECRAMAKFARSPESKATWDRLAARWVRCAELNELRSSAAALDRMAKRRRRPSLGRSSRVEAACASQLEPGLRDRLCHDRHPAVRPAGDRRSREAAKRCGSSRRALRATAVPVRMNDRGFGAWDSLFGCKGRMIPRSSRGRAQSPPRLQLSTGTKEGDR